MFMCCLATVSSPRLVMELSTVAKTNKWLNKVITSGPIVLLTIKRHFGIKATLEVMLLVAVLIFCTTAQVCTVPTYWCQTTHTLTSRTELCNLTICIVWPTHLSFYAAALCISQLCRLCRFQPISKTQRSYLKNGLCQITHLWPETEK